LKKNVFAVCDLESSYAYNFMDYMNRKKNSPFEVQAFTSVKSLSVFCENNEIDVLLISNDAMCNEVNQLGIEKILILSEGELLPELIEYPTIYKYQSSDHIIGEVMNYYADTQEPSSEVHVLKKTVKIIGIYSPVKHCLKTSFALTLGQLLAKDQNVLYLNLEEFSGFETLFGKEFRTDLSDLMYFIKQEKANITFRLNGVLQSLSNLDYIPPVQTPDDLRSITYEEWSKLLDEIVKNTEYEVIIIDFGESVQKLFSLLNKCIRIYMPIKDDVISKAKIDQFEKMLDVCQLNSLSEKIKKIKLPFHNSYIEKEFYIDQLVWSELGDYVRQLIREDM